MPPSALRILCVFGVGLLLAGLFCSCQTDRLAARADPRPPPPLPADLAARFAYEKAPVAPVFETLEDTAEWEKVRGTYRTICPVTGAPWKVTFEFWRSKVGSGPKPAVIVVPILAGRYPECDHLGRLMARNGMHAFFVHREDNVLALEGGGDPFETKIRRSVVNIRRTLDWVLGRPDVAPRVGLVGISLGAMLGTVTLAVEPRIGAGILIMGGGDLPGIMADSIETPVRRFKIHRMRENGWSEDDFKAAMAKEIRSDPLALAPFVGAARVQQYISKLDNKVPTAYQWKLWEALGRPEGFAIPIGHYTAVLYIGFAERNALVFMKKRLQVPECAPPVEARAASKVESAASSY